MKKLFLILALIPLLGMGAGQSVITGQHRIPAAATNSQVQSCGFQNVMSDTTTVTCTFVNNIGAGHLLVFCAADYSNAGAANSIANPSFTGDSGTFVNDQQNLTIGSSPSLYVSCWHVLSAGGGSKTITLTTTTYMGFPSLSGEEFICSSCSLDVASSGNLITSTTYPLTLTSDTITTTKNGDALVVFGATIGNSSVTFTAGTGYTIGTNTNFGADEYQIQATAGSTSGTIVATSRNDKPVGSIALSLAFK